MEADWEFEIGGDAPVIEAFWTGFVDLRAYPERVREVSECDRLPELADALVRLNAPNSPVWTSKTDVFTPEPVDPDEFCASAGQAYYAIACYIDLLPRNEQTWNDSVKAEEACRELCSALRKRSLGCCRVDIVIRRALVADVFALGTTAYLTGCGSSLIEAKERLGECLNIFTETVVGFPMSPVVQAGSWT